MYWMDNQKIITVSDMYEYAKENDIALLSNFSTGTSSATDFWVPYLYDSDKYDRAFCMRYKNFFFFDQDGKELVDDVVDRFVQSVEDFLLLNKKKYSELFKIEKFVFAQNDILIDYNIDAWKEDVRDISREYVSGERQDTGEDVSGQRTDVETNQVMAYNSNTFVDSTKTTDNKGSETDTTEYNKGEQTDTETVNDEGSFRTGTKGNKNSMYDNMLKFLEVWDGYSFYGNIFKDIAAEFLLL